MPKQTPAQPRHSRHGGVLPLALLAALNPTLVAASTLMMLLRATSAPARSGRDFTPFGRCDIRDLSRLLGMILPAIEGTAMTDVSPERPVLDTLAAMTAESVARCGLDDNSLLAARIAALAAVGAPAASYLFHVGPAMDAGVTLEQIQDILIAVAPIVGTPRTMDAALNVAEALGIVIAVLEDELEAEEEAQ